MRAPEDSSEPTTASAPDYKSDEPGVYFGRRGSVRLIITVADHEIRLGLDERIVSAEYHDEQLWVYVAREWTQVDEVEAATLAADDRSL